MTHQCTCAKRNICTYIGFPHLITIGRSCAAKRALYIIIQIYNTKTLDILKKLYQNLKVPTGFEIHSFDVGLVEQE